VFRASDPRIASDKPRGEITAKELLDLGAARIEKDFSDQPELQIELLGLAADIYDNMAEDERYATLQKRRIELARGHYGPTHPIVLNGLISEAEATTYRQDYTKAGRLLDEVDAQLNLSAQNHSLVRARWWLVKWELVHSANGSESTMSNAVDQSIALYQQLAPTSNDYAYVLSLKAMNYGRAEDYVQQRRYFEQALAVLEIAPDRSDADLQAVFGNYARNLEQLGDVAAAERTYVRAEDLARKTNGVHYPKYWLARAYHARLLHRQGERERAHAVFEEMLQSIPSDWKSTNEDAWARGEYADCLAAEGRARDAVPILQETLRKYSEHSQGSALPVWRLDLGDAYDRAGRRDEARAMLKAAVDEVSNAGQPDPVKITMFRERWGRFLLAHSMPGEVDFANAVTTLRDVVARAADRPSTELALAHSGLAHAALVTGDTATALLESDLALATLARVQALYDLRVQPQLWLVHSAVLQKNGDAAGARQWAEKALEASRRYDDPSSVAIVEAQGAVRLATATSGRK
jgi:tetratricopeptide (TPR) repeat protein